MKEKLTGLGNCITALLLSIWSLIALSFPMIGYDRTENGILIKDSGYTLFGLQSQYLKPDEKWMGYVLAAFCMILLICAVCSLLSTLFTMVFLRDTRKIRNRTLMISIGNVLITFSYFLVGTIYFCIRKIEFPTSMIFTLSYLPYLISIALLLAHFFLPALIQNVCKETGNAQHGSKENKLITLEKFKDLLDKGAITEAEYSKVKEEIIWQAPKEYRQ